MKKLLMIALLFGCTAPPTVSPVAHCATGDDGCVELPSLSQMRVEFANSAREDGIVFEGAAICQASGDIHICQGRARLDTVTGTYECTWTLIDTGDQGTTTLVKTCDLGPDFAPTARVAPPGSDEIPDCGINDDPSTCGGGTGGGGTGGDGGGGGGGGPSCRTADGSCDPLLGIGQDLMCAGMCGSPSARCYSTYRCGHDCPEGHIGYCAS